MSTCSLSRRHTLSKKITIVTARDMFFLFLFSFGNTALYFNLFEFEVEFLIVSFFPFLSYHLDPPGWGGGVAS